MHGRKQAGILLCVLQCPSAQRPSRFLKTVGANRKYGDVVSNFKSLTSNSIHSHVGLLFEKRKYSEQCFLKLRELFEISFEIGTS